jgi:ATP-dependent DNA helicase RecG
LFSDTINDKAIKRLEYLQKHTDGQKIAQYDLETRGPGEIYSTLQHGFPSLKLANLSDTKLISLGQQVLKELIITAPTFKLQSLVKITTSKTTGLN